MEGECWPNLIWEMARRRIPIALVNGRVSDKSYRKYRRASWLTKEVYQCVDRFYMQQAKDAERIINLGANPHQVFVSGNLKFDFPGVFWFSDICCWLNNYLVLFSFCHVFLFL